MKTTRVIRFAIAALLVSIGCAALLGETPLGVTAICFSSVSIVLLRDSELTRPVTLRQLWTSMPTLVVALALFILFNSFIPKSAGEDLIHRPAFVLPLWAFFMSGLCWRWRRERLAAR